MNDGPESGKFARFELFIRKYLFFRIPIYVALFKIIFILWPAPEPNAKMHAWTHDVGPITLIFLECVLLDSIGLSLAFFFPKNLSIHSRNALHSLIEFSPAALLIAWYLAKSILDGALIALATSVLIITLGDGLQLVWEWLVTRIGKRP